MHDVAPAEPLRVLERRQVDARSGFKIDQLGDDGFVYHHGDDCEFRYHLQISSREVASSIGTSTLLAAWNAAVYVAQIEDDRLTEAMTHGDYLEATNRVLAEHKGLWFNNECFVVAREHRDVEGETK